MSFAIELLECPTSNADALIEMICPAFNRHPDAWPGYDDVDGRVAHAGAIMPMAGADGEPGCKHGQIFLAIPR